MMPRLIIPILSLLLSFSVPSMAQHSVFDYKECLEQKGEDPIEYIFRLFEKADVVILGERDHRDMTQYDFITRLLADRRFAEKVGHVYTEVGVVNRTAGANFLVNHDWSDEAAFRSALHEQLRNEDYLFVWEKTNRSVFLDSLYRINQRLPQEKRIQLGLTDIAFDWSKWKSPYKYKKWLRANTYYNEKSKASVRDREMTRNFLRQYKAQTPMDGKRKALVITNQPHAISSLHGRTEGWRIKKALGAERVRIVCLNWYVFTSPGDYGYASKGVELIDDGRWDAAFQLTGCRAAGIDIKDTPFGRTPAWYWDDGTAWQDLADGFIFHTPFHEFRASIGIAGIIDDSCKEKLHHRLDIMYSAGETPSDNMEEISRYYNNVRTFPIPDEAARKRMAEQLGKWIAKDSIR